VLTDYKNLDYLGIQGNHIYLTSSKGNEDKTNDDYLGKGFTRSRVLQNTILGVYHSFRKPDGSYIMVQLIEIDRKGIPEWIYYKL